MKKQFSLVETFVAVTVAAVLVVVAAGPLHHIWQRNIVASGALGGSSDGTPPETRLLQTVKHDGHLWVISYAAPTVPTVFCHHPDCPCGKKDDH